MKFEGRPISARSRLVNAMLGLGLIFSVSACSGGETEPESEIAPAETPSEPSSGGIVELSAVWSTGALEKPAADIALAGGRSPILAIAYDGSGLQLFDLEGEPISEVAPYKVKHLASGHEIEVDGTRLTVFAGINHLDELKAYVYGDGLVAPVEIQIGSDPAPNIAGICADVASGDDGRLLNIGYWKQGSSDLVTFPVKSSEGELEWIETPTLSVLAGSINACAFYGGAAIPLSGDTVDAALLDREGYTGLVTLQRTGALQALTGSEEALASGGGELVRLLVNDGLSVTMPEEPAAVAALGKPLAGGYGGGLIVVSGNVGGEDKAIYIAADALTGFSTNDADRSD